MARCAGCQEAQACGCLVRGSGGISVTGAGSRDNPYIVSGGVYLNTENSPTVELNLTGEGSNIAPYILRADASLSLGELDDVSTTNTTVGHVLTRQAGGGFALAPPATIPPGTVNAGNGLAGDGTSGDPLRVRLQTNSGLEVNSTGLAISGMTMLTYTPQFRRPNNSVINIGNSTLTGVYMTLGPLVWVAVDFIRGSSMPAVDDTIEVTLPIASHSAHWQSLLVSARLPEFGDAPSERTGHARLEGGSRMTRTYVQRNDYSMRLNPNFPDFVGGTRINWSGWYRRA